MPARDGRLFPRGHNVPTLPGLWVEVPPADRWLLSGQLGGVICIALLGGLALWVGHAGKLKVEFSPHVDTNRLGFLAAMWCYAHAERRLPDTDRATPELPVFPRAAEKPHLMVMQSESFFDPRSFYENIRADVLAEYDQMRETAVLHGNLAVPAWGANTVRSEFAFLSGLSEDAMGVHRLNPYRRLAATGVSTLAHHLQQQGYRTVCVHPYPASFYQRDRVYPLMGFDEFIDVDGAERAGPYIADIAVAEKVDALLADAMHPTFVFVITMENHGPLHLETISETESRAYYHAEPPEGCEDLSIYLRHVRNADAMLAIIGKHRATRLALLVRRSCSHHGESL